MFKKIMVGLDGSSLARQAIPYAVMEAKQNNAQILLCRTVSELAVISPNLPGSPGLPIRPAAKEVQEQFRMAEKYLEAEAAELKEKTGIEVETDVSLGMEGGAIIKAAADNDIDLIVLSTHGSSGLERVVFGSTANYVVRESGIPNLVIRPQETSETVDVAEVIPAPKKILVALDGSRLAEQILPFAVDQAHLFASHLSLVQVVEAQGHEVTVSLTASADAAEKEKDHFSPEETDAVHYLPATADSFRQTGVHIDWSVLRGEKVGPAIVAYARQNEVDMVAICTHGRSGLNRVIFGSVADHVLRNSGLPVLIFKPRENLS